MDDLLRLGRPRPLLSTDSDETDGLYLDKDTALRRDVLGMDSRVDPRLSKPVARLPEPEERAPRRALGGTASAPVTPEPASASVPFSFPGMSAPAPAAASKPAAQPAKEAVPFAFPSFAIAAPETQTPAKKPGTLERIGTAIDSGITSLFGENKPAESQINQEGLSEFKAQEAEQLAKVVARRAELGTDSKDRGDAMKLFDSAAAGLGSAISGTLEFIADKVDSDSLRQLAEAGKREAMALTPKEQTTAQKLAAAGGSMLAFVAPGLGVAKGLQLAGLGVGAARTAGAGAAALLESAGVAQETFEKAMSETGNKELANERAWTAAAANLPLNWVTNKLGLFGGGSAVRQLGTTVLSEGAQEGSQQILTNKLGFKDVGEGVSESAAIGGLAGGGFKGGQLALERLFKEATPDEKEDLVKSLMDEGTAARQQVFDSMMEDERTAEILRNSGIESADDPRFTGMAIQIGKLDRQLRELDMKSSEEIAAERKRREEDIKAAFGTTASTGVGVGTGASEPLIRRDSVTPNPETRTLEGTPQPVVLPEGQTTPAGTLALAPEDLVARQEGFEVQPAFAVGDNVVGNRFVTMQQAETFLFGPKNKKTGEREGGYASTVEDMDFRIREGKRSKDAGGGTFFFVEGRAKTAANPVVAEVDAKANEAATSPQNDLPQPTDAQKKAGNYKKGNVKILGLNIAVENPRGSERSGTDASGKSWKQNMAHHYGYVRTTKGKDGDQVDVFLGPNPESGKVFVVDQINPDGTFDEHKAMLGFDSLEDARAGYMANYEQGWQGLGAISEMPADAFKSWVKDGTKRKPLAYAEPAAEAAPAPAAQQTEQAAATAEPAAATAVTPAATEAAPDAAEAAPVAEPTPPTETVEDRVKAEKAEPPAQVTERKTKDRFGNAVTEVTLPDGSKHQIIRLNSTESMGLPGWHDATKFGPNDGGFLGNTKDEAIKELIARQERAAQPKQTVEQALKAKAKKAKPAKAEPADAEVQKRDAAQTKADKQIGKKKVVKAEVIELWEDNDDGKAPHVAWNSLPAEQQQNWADAVADGYATIDLHDRITQTTLKNARTERLASKIKRDTDEGDGSFRIASGGKGMEVSALEKIVEAFKANWANMPDTVVVASEKDLPARLYGQVQRDKAEGMVAGAYWNGKVYLIARNISDLKDAVITVNHEVAGHFGLRSILGDKHAATMRDIYDGNKAVREAADTMMVKEGLDVETAVEEVLADFAESGKYPANVTQSALQKLYSAIRKALRDIFNVPYVSDADLREIVANARRYVEVGDVAEGEGGAAAADASLKEARAARRQQTAVFYSAMERAFRANKTEKMPASQWKSWLASKSKDLGVKKEEVEWTGINDWLDLKGNERLTKQEMLDWIAGNRVYVNEVVLSDDAALSPGDTEETFVYTEPTEVEIREFVREQIDDRTRDWEIEIEDQGLDAGSEPMPDELSVSPDDMDNAALRDWVAANFGWQNYMQMHRRDMERFQRGRVRKATQPRHTAGNLVLKGGKRHAELVLFDPTVGQYKSSDDTHYGDITKGRTIGWLRMNVRKDSAGNDVLFLEELQSQRGQDGRGKGFKSADGKLPAGWEAFKDDKNGWYVVDNNKTQVGIYADTREEAIGYAMLEGVPDAPFVKKTESWTALLLKRAIAYAQQQGIDRVAWTRGEQQNERYSLKQRVDQITYVKYKGEDRVELSGIKDGKEVFSRDVPKKELAAFVGNKMAEQIDSNTGLELDNEFETSGVIGGEDMEVGNVDLRPYYDQTVPSVAKQILKAFGGTTEIMEIEGTGQQLGFVIPENLQQTVAEDGLPMFRRKDYESQFSDLPAKVRDMALAKGHYSPPKIRERLEALKPRMWLRVVQKTFDKFRPIKDIDLKAYMQIRLSNSPQDGAVSGLLHYGQVFNDDGALNLKKDTKGLLEILDPVGGEVDRFLMWVAANRAGQLKKQDRENFFSEDEIAALSNINRGSMKNGKSRAGVYASVLSEMNELNRSVLDVARSTGLIDDAAYKRFSADIWYVPFYRQMEDDGSLSAANTSSGAVGQYLSKRLKGSTRQLNDLMENVLLNWSHILSASMKNQAANTTLESATEMGGIVNKLTPLGDGKFGRDKDGNKVPLKFAVKTMTKGKESYWEIQDEFLLASLDAVANVPQNTMWLNIAREFKTTLTRFISLSPTFKINNLIRDSIQSIGLTELSNNPVANVMQGYKAYKNERAEALVGGGLFAMGNAFDGDQAANVKRMLKQGVPSADILTTQEKVVAGVKRWQDKYDEVSDAMENANRLALYQQLRANGATHLEAAYAARDLQDFSLQGSGTMIRYLSQTVPYFNARLQGMYKLGRDGLDPVVQVLGGNVDASTRQKAAKFSAVLGAVTLMGVALYLVNHDDEDFKKLEEWQRDSFFWIKIPGTSNWLRIPKPFEMGAFATVAERLTEQMVDDKVEGKVFAKRLMHVLLENLAMNPMPQVFKPLYEIATNKDGFTGRAIESQGMERLSKENRVNAGTSDLAVGLNKVNGMFASAMESLTGGGVKADSMQFSPIQIDYLIRGYLGWVGSAVLTTSNAVTAPLKEGESSRFERIDDFLVVGNYIKTMPQGQSKYVTSFYENAKIAATVSADYQNFIKLGQMDKAVELAEDKGDMIALNKLYSKASKVMSDLTKQIKLIEDDKEMPGDVKRAEIEKLQQLRIDYAKQIEDAMRERRKEK
jgi:antitoxin component of RelBE/YafQ-DinJ toxin-antitoxin module